MRRYETAMFHHALEWERRATSRSDVTSTLMEGLHAYARWQSLIYNTCRSNAIKLWCAHYSPAVTLSPLSISLTVFATNTEVCNAVEEAQAQKLDAEQRSGMVICSDSEDD